MTRPLRLSLIAHVMVVALISGCGAGATDPESLTSAVAQYMEALDATLASNSFVVDVAIRDDSGQLVLQEQYEYVSPDHVLKRPSRGEVEYIHTGPYFFAKGDDGVWRRFETSAASIEDVIPHLGILRNPDRVESVEGRFNLQAEKGEDLVVWVREGRMVAYQMDMEAPGRAGRFRERRSFSQFDDVEAILPPPTGPEQIDDHLPTCPPPPGHVVCDPTR